MTETEAKAKALLEGWVKKQGHESCWYYPEIFEQLCRLFEVDSGGPPHIDRLEFEAGCCRYQDERYGRTKV